MDGELHALEGEEHEQLFAIRTQSFADIAVFLANESLQFATRRVFFAHVGAVFANHGLVFAHPAPLFAFCARHGELLVREFAMPSSIVALLVAARRALNVGSQGEFGVLLGSSQRSGQRWETGMATPSYAQLQRLVGLVYPQDADLAGQIAAALGTDLVSLGLAAPPLPPPPPPPPPQAAEDVVDAVVCAAAEAIDVTPREVRPALLAAFTRARRLGLGVEAVEKALGKATAVRDPGPEALNHPPRPR